MFERNDRVTSGVVCGGELVEVCLPQHLKIFSLTIWVLFYVHWLACDCWFQATLNVFVVYFRVWQKTKIDMSLLSLLWECAAACLNEDTTDMRKEKEQRETKTCNNHRRKFVYVFVSCRWCRCCLQRNKKANKMVRKLAVAWGVSQKENNLLTLFKMLN